MSEIRRINSYNDSRFSQDVLNEHGAFIVDDEYKCQFKIKSLDSAVIYCDRTQDIDLAIEEFRFYSENISKFYNDSGSLIKEFPPVDLVEVMVECIQPSQFYVNEEKVDALSNIIESSEDIVIPVCKIGEDIISLDGHTRLYIAFLRGFKKVNVFYTEPFEYIEGFVREAKERKVFKPSDLTLLSSEDYKEKWHKYCEDFFSKKK